MRALAVFLALLAWPAAWGPTRAAPGQPPERRVELELLGVLAIADGNATLVVLKEKGARTLLPLLLPGPSGRAMAADLKAHRAPELLGGTLRALGARVQEVEFVDAHDEVGSGRARLSQGSRVVDVAGRPSELVALAVATGAPMYTSRRLLDVEGLTPEDIDRARREMGTEGDGSDWL